MADRDANVIIDIEQRTFYLFDEINELTIGALYSNMMTLIMQDNTLSSELKEYEVAPIKLFINSHGGNVCDMWALVDLMELSDTPIETYCTGYAESAALSIFLAGHKRYITKHATLMYHQVSSLASGTYQDLEENQKEVKWHQTRIEEYVLSKTKVKPNKLKEVCSKKQDWFIHANEAVKLGFADAILN